MYRLTSGPPPGCRLAGIVLKGEIFVREIREELIRLARESGIPVPPGASVTEVVHLLGSDTHLSTDLCEALNHILAGLGGIAVPAPCKGRVAG